MLSHDLAKRFVALMLYTRGVDQTAVRLYKRGILSLWPSCVGQEAAQVGSVLACGSDTYIFPSYRDHAAALARGITPPQLLSQWAGTTFCGWTPSEVNFHCYNLVVAAQLLHAVGFAMGLSIKNSDQVVMTYFGDGATSQGDFAEALNLAAVRNAPVLFFCQNNGWAISTSVDLQMKNSIADRAKGFGVNSVRVDGNNIEEVYRITSKAIAQVRSGNGPFLIEAVTMRMAGHTTADTPALYRNELEMREWSDKDPIDGAIELLETYNWHQDGWLQQLRKEIDTYCQELMTLRFADPDVRCSIPPPATISELLT
ncbi:thiamine pyrophosphate-dependent dehydrogenase E1 component subunit alpha [Mycobacteroides abscessus]|uniref:thiamine pyrophosphate-dependent dehydrogenase E1 component subunit alpha n=1 Tax=Mycobacteroides abscessus TaxID=36809 RepID=UPI000C25934B|nr:thiamine pyrophosphate-dependent enzyme [Mycobacteroides abscessus]